MPVHRKPFVISRHGQAKPIKIPFQLQTSLQDEALKYREQTDTQIPFPSRTKKRRRSESAVAEQVLSLYLRKKQDRTKAEN